MKRLYFVTTLLLLFSISIFSQTLEDINKAVISGLDEVAPFSEGLAGVRMGNQWGFIDKEGQLVIDFRKDVVWNANADFERSDIKGVRYPQFKNGLCLVKKMSEEGIPLYGFIDMTGKEVIKPEFVNVTEFKDGYAIGIYRKKTFIGQNEIKLKVFDYSFMEVVLNAKGEIMWPISERDNILMSKKRYEMPDLHAMLISKDLLAVKGDDNQWDIRKLTL